MVRINSKNPIPSSERSSGEELEGMIRVGAFDEFGETRTRQFWQAQQRPVWRLRSSAYGQQLFEQAGGHVMRQARWVAEVVHPDGLIVRSCRW